MAPQLTLYTITACPYCIRVKRHLARLKLTYREVHVPRIRAFRKQVQQLSGQKRVPVLVDGDCVVADSQVICDYLTRQYGAGAQTETPDPQLA